MSDADESNLMEGDPYEAISQLTDHEPERHDLVIGFVAAIGTKWESILLPLEESIRTFRYRPRQISLADLLREVYDLSESDSPDSRSPEYYDEYMNAGDLLRKGFRSGSALAALAIRRIVTLRRQAIDDMSAARAQSLRVQPESTVYLLKSLKHPEEVKLLRQVYGESFFLLGVASNEIERRKVLAESFSYLSDSSIEVERLIARDQADHKDVDYGQNVRDTYARADSFIRIGEGRDCKREIHRIISLLFGDPFITPNPSEEAMRLAQDAAARSAAIPRQIGAALVPSIGTPVVTGTNAESRESVIEGTRATALIEFTRCLHAEQAAITNAAMAGIATKGATLYSTTFPCHECAKIIVGAGISEVQYVEPYPKSLVGQLYRGIIETAPPEGDVVGGDSSVVVFRQFAGISPRRFGKLFSYRQREQDGSLVNFVAENAFPSIDGYSRIAVETYESEVIKLVTKILDDAAFSNVVESEGLSLKIDDATHSDVRDNQAGISSAKSTIPNERRLIS